MSEEDARALQDQMSKVCRSILPEVSTVNDCMILLTQCQIRSYLHVPRPKRDQFNFFFLSKT